MDTNASLISGLGGISTLIARPRTTDTSSENRSRGLTGFGPSSVVSLTSRAATAASTILGASVNGVATSLPPAVLQRQATRRNRDAVEASTALLNGENDKAREVARRMLALDNQDADAYHIMARSFQGDGDMKQAAFYFGKAAELDPGNERYASDQRNAQLLQQSDAAVIKAGRGLLKNPQTREDGLRLLTGLVSRTESPTTLMALGDALFELEAKQQALSVYADAFVVAGGEDLRALLERADIMVADSPEAAIAHQFRGRVLKKMERFDEAIAAFRSARSLDSTEAQYTLDLADALTARGQSRVATGDLLGARGDLEEARSMRPSFAEYKNNIVDVRLRLGQQWISRGALRTALTELDEAKFRLPSDSDELKRRLAGLYAQLGNRYTSRGDHQTAAGTLQKAYDLNGSSFNKRSLGASRNTYGLELMAEEDYANAVVQFQAAVDLFPENAEYAANLAAAQNALNPPPT